jgi:hypothetical protein
VKQGGHGIVSTLGLEGPTKGSGLNVIRYDSESLHNEFAVHFRLLGSIKEQKNCIRRHSRQPNSFCMQKGPCESQAGDRGCIFIS